MVVICNLQLITKLITKFLQLILQLITKIIKVIFLLKEKKNGNTENDKIFYGISFARVA